MEVCLAESADPPTKTTHDHPVSKVWVRLSRLVGQSHPATERGVERLLKNGNGR